MKNKLIFYPVILFGSAVLIAFVSSLFLTVTMDDVLYHKRQVNADWLNSPWPGKAFAYHKPTGRFKASPLCSVDMDQAEIAKDTVTFHARNKVGQQFSEALSFMMKTTGVGNDAGFELHSVSIVLPLEKSFSSVSETPYMEYCIEDVASHAADPDYVVYQVENAYFGLNEETGHNEWMMVSFKPKPIIFTTCEPGSPNNPVECDWESLDYQQARWVTRLKHFLDLISVS